MKSSDDAAAKAALRASMRARRLAFAESAPTIRPSADFLARIITGGVTASYVPMAGEADPGLLVEAVLARNHRLALPHVTGGDQPMCFLSWQPGDPLEPGRFGLQQPRADAPVLLPDIILTPLVAFDAALNRLGQGAGYYDKAFASLPSVLRIGVAWSIQRVPTLPTQPWDVPLHGIVTETGWIEPEPMP